MDVDPFYKSKMSLDSSFRNGRLSQIKTNWAEVFCASRLSPAEKKAGRAEEAQRDLLLRYAGPVYRYLLAAVHDTNVADDLAQEFAFRIVRGDFRNAAPENGRFRDFVKRALINLVTDHFRRRTRQPRSLGVSEKQIADPNESLDMDKEFDRGWREEVLKRTWKALDSADQNTQTCYSVVLKARAENPSLDSTALAELVGCELSRDLNAPWLRQTLKRARARFSDLLRDEVRRTLGSLDEDEVDAELAQLGLLKYSR